MWRFVLANLAVVVIASGVVLGFVEAYYDDVDDYDRGSSYRIARDNREVRRLHSEAYPRVLIPFNFFLISTICLSAFLKFRDLSSSGGAVAQMLGGEWISSETSDPLERRFLNVIEEMAIASNMPVPEAYVLGDQDGINAFASGPSPEHSAIAVTRGALERLSRDELQGVVAHEFSHIMHADVRLNLRLAAYVYGLLVVMDMGNSLMDLGLGRRHSLSVESADDDSGSKGGALSIFLAGSFLSTIGLVGKVVSLILSAAVSREREYLADATAVELTRNPQGIVGALKKIGGYKHGSKVSRGGVKGLAHFFLADAGSVSFLSRMFSTHPPLAERIYRLDPAFTGSFPESEGIFLQSGMDSEGVVHLNAGNFVEAGERTRGYEAQRRTFEVPFMHSKWMPPFDLHPFIVDLGFAEGSVCALLLSPEEGVQARQRELLGVWIKEEEIALRAELFSSITINQKLSVVLMALPTIQAGSETRRKTFQGAVRQLVEMDGRESLVEFLALVLISYAMLDTDPSFSIHGASSKNDLKAAQGALSVVLSACARFSVGDDSRGLALLRKAAVELEVECDLVSEESHRADAFLASIQRLRNLAPNARASLISAIESMVLADGSLAESDIAVMRLFAILLRTPLPAIIERGSSNLICQNN